MTFTVTVGAVAESTSGSPLDAHDLSLQMNLQKIITYVTEREEDTDVVWS